MLNLCALGFLIWIFVRPPRSLLSAGVTMKSDLWENDSLPSVLSVEVCMAVVVTVGIISCWKKPTNFFGVALSSNAPHLNFP